MDKQLHKAILEAVNTDTGRLGWVNRVEAAYGNKIFGEAFEYLTGKGYIENMGNIDVSPDGRYMVSLQHNTRISEAGLNYLRALKD